MKLFLVRHGETDANRILGHHVTGPMHNEPVTFSPGQSTDISLNVNGRAQVLESCATLPETIDHLYTSPLLRTKETAEIIADNKKFNKAYIKVNDKLVEYHQGSFEGLPADQKKGGNYGSALLCNYDYTAVGGDSWKIIYDRVEAFLNELKNTYKDDEKVVCVTSGGVIRMTYKILFADKAPYISRHINVKNGSVHEFIC